jgi:Ca2+-binding RTX toxin-like protein
MKPSIGGSQMLGFTKLYPGLGSFKESKLSDCIFSIQARQLLSIIWKLKRELIEMANTNLIIAFGPDGQNSFIGRNGMTVTLNQVTLTDLGNGYTTYNITYSEKNLTTKAIDQATFKLYFDNTDPIAQYGFFGNVLPGESFATTRSYSFTAQSSAKPKLLEYDNDHFFAIEPINGALQWQFESNQLSWVAPDLTPPTIAISASDSNLLLGESSIITFTVSEPSIDFNASDVTVSGGYITNFSGNSTVYTAKFAPYTNSVTDGIVSVSSNKFTDAAGNANVDGADSNNTVRMMVETLLPIIGTTKGEVLIGGAGNNTLTGGGGADTFKITSGTDFITDLGFGGTDVLRISLGATANAKISSAWNATSATQNNGVANLTTEGFKVSLNSVTGSSGFNVTNTGSGTTIVGSKFNDFLNGGIGKDVLVGGFGNDTLNGAGGNDSLTGGTGSDTFNITIGTDTILDLGLDKDILKVSSNATASITMKAAWTATPDTSNEGTVNITTKGLLVNVADSAGSKGYSITNLGKGSTLVGSAFTDTLKGGTGIDEIVGGSGDDLIFGNTGNDILTGNDGNDIFVFNSSPNKSHNVDTITDFAPGVDKLEVSKSVFKAFNSTGNLNNDAFNSGAGVSSASDSNDRFIYNSSTGALYYDADGNGRSAPIQIALVGVLSHPILTNGDFEIIS